MKKEGNSLPLFRCQEERLSGVQGLEKLALVLIIYMLNIAQS
jgi:hypothetical protein